MILLCLYRHDNHIETILSKPEIVRLSTVHGVLLGGIYCIFFTVSLLLNFKLSVNLFFFVSLTAIYVNAEVEMHIIQSNFEHIHIGLKLSGNYSLKISISF